MEERNEYDLDGKKVLLLINVQNYKNKSELKLLNADIDVEEIQLTFEERVT